MKEVVRGPGGRWLSSGNPAGRPIGSRHRLAEQFIRDAYELWKAEGPAALVQNERAGMPFPTHPHMLRHSCGFLYANQGKDTRSLQAYLGHRNIQSTVRYSAMASDCFRGWERD